jgi:exodeoxyribonuclease VII small subunit
MPDQSELSYEEAREELAAVVQRLEAGGVTLEETLALWERGEKLAQECREWLDGARRRLEAVTEGSPEGVPGSVQANDGSAED